MLRRTGPAAAGPLDRLLDDSPSAPMSSTGTTTSISSGLRMPASTMVTGRGCATSPAAAGVEAAEEAGDLVERPLGGRQADALGRPLAEGFEPLEGERQVRAPLGGGQRVDLVDDHRLDVAQGLAGRRGEHEVERLGRGDEQVGRVAHELAALVGRGVARAHADGGRVEGTPSRSAASPMPMSGARRFFSTSTASARSGDR